MTEPLFDRLEDQLRGAAHARTAARRPGARREVPGWLRAGGRLLPLAVGVAAAAAILVAAFVLLRSGAAPTTPAPAARIGHLSPPPSGASPFVAEADYLTQITGPVRTSAVCRASATVTGAPSRALRDELAVLRRPADRADDAGASLTPAFPDGVRLARIVGGTSFYVIETRLPADGALGSAACLAAERAALHREAPLVPLALRAATVALGLREFGSAARSVDMVCLGMLSHAARTAQCPNDTATALRRPQLPELIPGLARFAAIVPDGVATVVVRVTRPGAHTFSGDARGNVAIIPVGSGETEIMDATVLWRDAAGRVVAQTDVRPLTQPVYCARHPFLCLNPASGGGFGTSAGQSTTAAAVTSTTAGAVTSTTTAP